MEPDRRGAGIVRAGVGPDDALAEIREVEPFVVHETLDQLHHRPLEEERARLGIAVQPLLDPLARRCIAHPQIPVSLGPERVAHPAFELAHRPPPPHVSRRQPAHLGLAARVVVPELDARAVLEGHEHAPDGRMPPEATARKVELSHYQWVQQSDHVRAGRHPDAGPGFFEGARTANPLPGLEHEHPAPGAGEIGGAGQSIVSRAHHDRIPAPACEGRDRLR